MVAERREIIDACKAHYLPPAVLRVAAGVFVWALDLRDFVEEPLAKTAFFASFHLPKSEIAKTKIPLVTIFGGTTFGFKFIRPTN